MTSLQLNTPPPARADRMRNGVVWLSEGIHFEFSLKNYGTTLESFTSYALIGAMLHGLEYGVSDTGMDPNVRFVKAVTLGHGDTVQN